MGWPAPRLGQRIVNQDRSGSFALAECLVVQGLFGFDCLILCECSLMAGREPFDLDAHDILEPGGSLAMLFASLERMH